VRSKLIRLFFFCLLIIPAGIVILPDMIKEKSKNNFPYSLVKEIDPEIKEPSGIVFHALRKTLFVVGDKGDLCEMTCEGKVLNKKRIIEADFEGITCNPSTGLLYIAIEGDEKIIETEPEKLEIKRGFTIESTFDGKEVLRQGGDGLEGITFLPRKEHREGGTFYVTNQGDEDDPEDDPCAVIEVELPIVSRSEKHDMGKIINYFNPLISDMSGLHYDCKNNILYVISDDKNLFLKFTENITLLDGYTLPGKKQEGITFDDNDFLYIAQDAGGILKFKPLNHAEI